MATTVALVAVTIALLTMAYKPGTNEPKQILTVKASLSGIKSSNGIFLTRPNGELEVTEIEAKGLFSREQVEELNKKTTLLLNKVVNEGYTLVSVGGGGGGLYEVYVFEK